MKVRALRQSDAPGPRGEHPIALFEGQVYDLPLDVCEQLIAEGVVEAVEAEPSAPEAEPEQQAAAPRRRRRRRNE